MLRKKNIDMTQGPIWRQLTTYMVPILVGELLQQFYTMVDSAVVGQYVGSGALAAVGTAESIVKVLVGFFNGMAVGFTVVIAQYYGARDQARLNQAVNSVLQLAFLLGIVMTVGGIALIRPILGMMDTTPALLPQATTYLTIYYAGIMGFVLYNTAAGILRAVGDVRTPLCCLFISSTLNIILDLAMVVWMHMGVAGAAYATIFSQWIATIASLWVLIRRSDGLYINPLQYHLDARMALRLLQMGMPTGLQKTISSLSNVLVLSRIAFFGDACLAGWVVYNKLDHLLTVLAQSIGSALSTFVGQNIGAGKYHRIEQGVRITLVGGSVLFLGVSSILVVLRAPFVRIFVSDPDTIYYAERFVLVITFLKLTQLFMNVYAAALRGMGRMTLVTVIMLSGIVGFRQVYLLVITSIRNIPWLVGIAYPAGWSSAGIVLLLVYLYRIRIIRGRHQNDLP